MSKTQLLSEKACHYDDEYWTRKAMRVYGGSFVQQLGILIDHADTNNYLKLEETFPEYCQQYREMGQKLKEDEIARQDKGDLNG